MKKDLIYDDFKEYEVLWEGKEDFDNGFKLFGNDSYSHRFRFENDFGASVVKHYGSYGYEDDLFELAVLDYINDDFGRLCYTTTITDDVEGYLSNEDVLKLLNRIKKIKR